MENTFDHYLGFIWFITILCIVHIMILDYRSVITNYFIIICMIIIQILRLLKYLILDKILYLLKISGNYLPNISKFKISLTSNWSNGLFMLLFKKFVIFIIFLLSGFIKQIYMFLISSQKSETV